MTIQSYKVGAGTLKLGPAGVQDISAQCIEMAVVPSENVKTTDAINVLSGEQLAAEDDVTTDYALVGNVLQDIAAAQMVAYSWTQNGNTVAFEYIPNTAAARKVTGNVRIVALKIGGAAKTRPQADINWKIIGTPVFAAAP